MMKAILLLSTAAVLALPSCGTTSSPSSTTGEDNDLVAGVLANDLVDETAYASKDATRISVPVLRAPDLEAKGNRPGYSVMGDGSYAARYTLAGGRYLTIIGTPRPSKTFAYGPVGTLSLMGRTTGYYSTGNEDPEISTKATVLTAPDGRSATYVVIHGGPQGGVTEKSLSTGIPRLSF